MVARVIADRHIERVIGGHEIVVIADRARERATADGAACGKALEVDVVSVQKIASMLERGTATTPAPSPRPTAAAAARFARDPGEYATGGRARLRLVHPTAAVGADDEGVRR